MATETERSLQAFNVSLLRPNIKHIGTLHNRLWTTVSNACNTVFASGRNTQGKRTTNKVWSMSDVHKIENIDSRFADIRDAAEYLFRIEFKFELRDGRIVQGFLKDTYTACDCCFMFEGNCHISDE
jgi:hypothetical protein